VYTTLLYWNREDPVNTWEQNRNDIIFNNYQHNRNPFIDHPELAEYLWGDSVGLVWMPDVIDGVVESFKTSIKVYPNPTIDNVTITGEFERIIVYNSRGQILSTGTQSIVSLNAYSSGIYFIRVISKSGDTAVFPVSKR
jgi:hypothetical protein